MEATIEQITAQAQTLTPTQQQKVLDFMRLLHAPPHTLTPPGTPGRDLMHLVGLFPPEDAEEILRAVEEDCERIDPDGW